MPIDDVLYVEFFWIYSFGYYFIGLDVDMLFG